VFEGVEADGAVFETMIEENAEVAELAGVVTLKLEEPVDEDEADEAVPDVDEAEEPVAVDAPIEKVGVVEKTSVMLPMLTASRP